MKQNIPKAYQALTSFAGKGIEGLRRFGAKVGLVHNTEEIVRAILQQTLEDDEAYQAARTARMAATAAVAVADKRITTFLTVTRELIKPTLGSRYSQVWNEVGFRNNTLAMPRTFGRRVGLATSFGQFLTAHPEFQVPGVATPEIATELCKTAVTSTADVNGAMTLVRQKRAARDASLMALTARLRKLYRELREFLTPDDPRWLEFGFNIPAAKSVPAAPGSVEVKPGLPGNVSVSWQKPATSEHFRIFGEIVGVDEAPVPIVTTAETSIQLKELTSGARMKLYVTAVNGAGESLPSDIMEIVVP